MTSVLTPTHGINVVLNQRQLSSGVSLVLSVFKVWVPSQCNQCDGSKQQSQHQPLLGVMALQFGDFFCQNWMNICRSVAKICRKRQTLSRLLEMNSKMFKVYLKSYEIMTNPEKKCDLTQYINHYNQSIYQKVSWEDTNKSG